MPCTVVAVYLFLFVFVEKKEGGMSNLKLPGNTDEEKLVALGNKTYKEQAVWFLNAFWLSFGQEQAERIWANVHLMAELDTAKKAQGCAVDEFMAHHFLEKNQETLTVQKMRLVLLNALYSLSNYLKPSN